MIKIKGHDNPDVDSIVSCVLLEKLKRWSGIQAKAVIPDTGIEKDTLDIIKNTFIVIDSIPKEISVDDELILVDHYKDNLPNKVIDIFDHHPTSEKHIGTNIPASSTASILYKLMKAVKYPISSQEMYAILVATFVDTCSLTSSKFIKEDMEWIDKEIEEYHFSKEKLTNIGYCLTDLNMSVDNLSKYGRKNYDYSGKKVSSSYIQINDPDMDVTTILDWLKLVIDYEKIDMWVFLVHDFSDMKTEAYFLENGKNLRMRQYDHIASRGAEVMPEVELEIKERVQEIK